MKATNHPKIIIDVDSDFKQQLVDICQIKNVSMKSYILDLVKNQMKIDSESFGEKLELLKQIRT
jgi:hypothetical protein